MKHVQSLVNRLESVVRADVEAQHETREALEALALAVRSGAPADVEAATARVHALVGAGRARSAKRAAVLEAFAELFGVPASVLTIASIAERVGAPAERLRELRAELRAGAAAIARLQRRIAASVRCQRRVIEDALAILLTSGASDDRHPMHERGMLVDARV